MICHWEYSRISAMKRTEKKPCLQTVDLHGSTLYLFVHYYKQEIDIFECPRYSWIKEEKMLKVWGASDWEISSTFGENTGSFSIGTGVETWPQKQAWKIPVRLHFDSCRGPRENSPVLVTFPTTLWFINIRCHWICDWRKYDTFCPHWGSNLYGWPSGPLSGLTLYRWAKETSSNRIVCPFVCPSVCLSVCLSVIPSRLQTKCNI